MADDLRISIGAETSGLKQGVAEAKQGSKEIAQAFESINTSKLKTAVGQLSREFDNLGKSAEINADKIRKIGDAGQNISSLGATLTAGLTLPIVGLGAASVKAYGEIQSLEKGLEAVMGSADKASAELNKLKEVAKLPGLGMKEAVQGSINLQAIGISANKSRNILQQFGNAVATVGKGRVEFERAIYGVQQLANTDFPLGEDLNIIKDALPQVSNLLKEAFGSSRSDELAKMGVSSKQVLDTILAGLGKLPRVTGGIKGAFENLGDAMQTNLARIGKIIDKNINISGLIDKITGFIDNVVSAFEKLDPAFQIAILGVAAFAAAIGPLIVTVGGFMALLPTLTAGVSGLGVAFTAMTGPIGLVVIGIAAIITAVVANWDKIDPYIQGTVEWFKRLNNESFAVRTTIQGIGFAFNALGVIAIEVVKNIWQNFKTLGKGLLELFAGIGGVIEGAITLDWEKVKAGYSRGMNSIANAVVGVAVNSANSFDTVLNKMSALEKKWSSFDVNKISIPGLDKAVEKEADEKITKGLNAASGKIKKIELPEIEPIKFSGSVDKLSYLGKMFGTPLEIENYINGLVDSFRNGFGQLNTTISEGQARLITMNAEISKAWSEDLSNGISNGISNVIGSIGNALGEGGGIVQAIGKSVLSMIGSIATQLGQSAIGIGVGMIAIKAAFKNPYTAIAAGIALVALGSFISGSVSKIPEGGSGGSSGISTATGSSGSNSYSSNFTSGGSSGGEVRFRIEGTDLVGVLERNNYKTSRLNAG